MGTENIHEYMERISRKAGKNVYFDMIVQWAHDRNIVKGSTMHAQMVKLSEEVGELARGITKNNDVLIRDSIGDCIVVLTILAEQKGMSIEDCIYSAYNEIKNRRGKMVDGIFMKEEENGNT